MATEELRKTDGSVILEGRQRLSLTGVSDVLSFDEREISAETAEGMLLVTGDELHVERLSLDAGDLIITGRVDGLEYVGDKRQKSGFWSKLF
ncbi:MAG: sporulation protein YabP [Ruminococcaceae bacterium]|nr:sporulation protein YabP [Oscillospiraceae bacterium]